MNKGFPSLVTGLIIGCAPLTVTVFTPIFSLLVSDQPGMQINKSHAFSADSPFGSKVHDLLGFSAYWSLLSAAGVRCWHASIQSLTYQYTDLWIICLPTGCLSLSPCYWGAPKALALPCLSPQPSLWSQFSFPTQWPLSLGFLRWELVWAMLWALLWGESSIKYAIGLWNKALSLSFSIQYGGFKAPFIVLGGSILLLLLLCTPLVKDQSEQFS